MSCAGGEYRPLLAITLLSANQPVATDRLIDKCGTAS
jgi:hypothetical protein